MKDMTQKQYIQWAQATIEHFQAGTEGRFGLTTFEEFASQVERFDERAAALYREGTEALRNLVEHFKLRSEVEAKNTLVLHPDTNILVPSDTRK